MGWRELLQEARDNGLIYWEPNTQRGAEAKRKLIAKIDTFLSTTVEAAQGWRAKEEAVAWLYCNDSGDKELILDCNSEHARRLLEMGYTEQPLFSAPVEAGNEGDG